MKKLLLSFLTFISIFIFSQTQLVFVYFKDKPNAASFYANPTSELSQKSLDRRTKLGIALNDQDAPIEPAYIQNIKDLGFTVTDYSKWLNGVAVNATSEQITLLQGQSYVQSVESFIVHPLTGKTAKTNTNKKFSELLSSFDYGNGASQIDQINLRQLHLAGFTGSGITIAVIDTGFPTVDTGSAYARIRDNNQIKGGYNFISKNSDIYNTSLSTHGSTVLGAIAGYIDGSFVGSAPDANFYLYCSEVNAVEIPEEELYWIESAEDADRKGVDLITTSLGYSTFDDIRYNLTYADMNGKVSFIARVAEIAVNKGIFVLAAAGNSGQKDWHYILTPADNAKVFTIGAVDSSGNPSSFSSYGPNAEGVIKPDGSARGSSTATVYNNSVTSSNGTSLSTPVAAGGVTCLIQAFPTMNRDTMRDLLRKTASLYPGTSLQMGYGILNFGSLFDSLNNSESNNNNTISIYPNPVQKVLNISTDVEISSIEIYDHLGRLILKNQNSQKIKVENMLKGVYYLKIATKSKTFYKKFIKE